VSIWLKILATLGLVVFNAFFVAAEFAAVSARATRLRIHSSESMAGRASLLIKNKLNLFLSSCQFGNTLASLALGAVTEPAVASLMTPITHALHVSARTQGIVAFIISFSLAVSLHIIIGEQAPKNIAIQFSDRLLAVVSIPLVIFTFVFYPAIWLLNTATSQVLGLLGLNLANSGHGMPHSEEELQVLLMQAVATGTIAQGKARLLANAFEFGELKVRQIMTPRPEVDFLRLDQPPNEILRTVQRSAFTRFPLCDGDLDHVVGQIHMKDLFSHLKLVTGKLKFTDEKTPEGDAIAIAAGLPGSAMHVIGSGQIDLRQIKREVMFIPEQMPLPRVLRQFQQRRLHLAVVVDEYGSTRGIVTMEDVLEELVGQIEDEFDPVMPSEVVKEGETIRVNGLFPMHELRDRLPIEVIETPEVDTIGGYIVRQLHRWPRVGDEITLGNYRARVLTVQQRRIGQVLISPVDPAKPTNGDGDSAGATAAADSATAGEVSSGAPGVSAGGSGGDLQGKSDGDEPSSSGTV